MKIKVACFSSTLALIYRSTRRHVPEYRYLPSLLLQMRTGNSTQRTKKTDGGFGEESYKPTVLSYQANVKSASLSRWINPNQLATFPGLDRRVTSQSVVTQLVSISSWTVILSGNESPLSTELAVIEVWIIERRLLKRQRGESAVARGNPFPEHFRGTSIALLGFNTNHDESKSLSP